MYKQDTATTEEMVETPMPILQTLPLMLPPFPATMQLLPALFRRDTETMVQTQMPTPTLRMLLLLTLLFPVMTLLFVLSSRGIVRHG